MSTSEENKPVEKVEEVKEQPQAQQPQQGQPVFSFTADQLESLVSKTVKSVIESSRTEEMREKIADYNNKISEAVQSSQASLIRPKTKENESSLDYVNRVIEDDIRERRRNPEGKAYYADKGEDLTKAKIIILKKMGLSNAEIAKIFDN